MSTEKTYTPALDAEGRWYPDGPGNGFGYYSGLVWPETRCVNRDEAERLCKLLGEAYAAGVAAQVRRVKEALGL